MPFKVEVGPPQIAIHQAQTVLVTDPDGQVSWPSEKGLYFLDTRVDQRLGDLRQRRAVGSAERRRRHATHGAHPPDQPRFPHRGRGRARTQPGFVIGRRLGGGMHEDLDVTNHGRKHVRFNLEIAIRSDFADVFEVKSNRIVRRGRITTEWPDATQRTPHRLSQPGLPPRGADRRAAGGPPRRLRQWPAQLRGAARPRTRLALLPAL